MRERLTLTVFAREMYLAMLKVADARCKLAKTSQMIDQKHKSGCYKF